MYFIFTVVLSIYFPVATTGYFVYGLDLKDNILDTISKGPIHNAVLILITAHLLLAYVIVLNPVVQHFESFLKIPKRKFR